MGKINKGSRGIHGDTPATSQAQANASCQFFNFIPGINLLEVYVLQPNPTSAVLTDTPNRISLSEVNSQTYSTTGLS